MLLLIAFASLLSLIFIFVLPDKSEALNQSFMGDVHFSKVEKNVSSTVFAIFIFIFIISAVYNVF